MSTDHERDDDRDLGPEEREPAASHAPDSDAGDELLRAALARGLSYREAGQVAHVSQRTVARRMADPSFAVEVSRARAEFVGEVTGQLLASGADALAALRACLDADGAGDRRRAAVDLLRLGLAYRSHADLEAEVLQLRERVDLLLGGGGGDDGVSR